VEHSYGAYYDLSTWEQDPANVEHIWLYDLHIKPTVNSNVVSPVAPEVVDRPSRDVACLF